MKLRNKKTGEIGEFRYLQSDYAAPLVLTTYENDKPMMYSYNSLAELNEEWEDYEEPKEYWFIDIRYPKVEPKKDINLSNSMRKRLKEIGNYFETKEEAEKAVEKLKAWKRLKDRGVEFYGWRRNHTGTYDLLVRWEDRIPRSYEVKKDLDLLFSQEED